MISLVCVLVLVFSSLPVSADNIADVESRTLDLQYQLAGFDQELLALSEEITATETLIEQTNGAIIRSTYALAEAEADRDSQQESMAIRIRFMYEVGNASLLELLFSAESITEFLNKAEFIQSINTHDREMLVQLQDVLDTVTLYQDDLVFQQNALIEIQDDLEAQQVELTALAEETATDLDVFLALLEQLRTEEALLAAAAVAAEPVPPANDTETENNSTPPANDTPPTNNTPPGNTNAGGGGSGGGGGNQPPINASTDELTLFAALLEAEAFQNYDSLLAVATVILNRVADPRFPNSVTAVINQPGQFGPVTNGSLNRILARGPTALSRQVAADALGGARSSALTPAHTFFNHAGASSQPGINIGGNIFWTFWPNW